MIHLFDIARGEPYRSQVGEQWITEAMTFKTGAQAIGEPGTPNEAIAKARLLEHAAVALQRAAAETSDHKKSDRLEAEAKRCGAEAGTILRATVAFWPHLKANDHAKRLIDSVE